MPTTDGWQLCRRGNNAFLFHRDTGFFVSHPVIYLIYHYVLRGSWQWASSSLAEK
jgi:hypothetical protein